MGSESGQSELDELESEYRRLQVQRMNQVQRLEDLQREREGRSTIGGAAAAAKGDIGTRLLAAAGDLGGSVNDTVLSTTI